MELNERILFLLKDQGKTAVSLADYLGIKSSSITGWKNEGSYPSSKHILEISEFLNVSLEYLITGKESNIITIEVEKRVEQFTGDTGRMTDPEVDIIHKFRKLDERDQEDTIAYVNMKYNRTMDFQKERLLKYQSGEETTATLEKKHA